MQTTRTLTLAEFLLARIGEDEHRAHAAAAVEGGDVMLATLPTPLFDGLRVAFPRRVLAECEAKRQIIAEYREMIEPGDDGLAAWREDMSDDDLWPEYGGGVFYALRLAVRVLATVYADHPDYRPEWRP